MKSPLDWKTELLRRQGRDADWDWVAVWEKDIQEIQTDAAADKTENKNEQKHV